MSETDDDRDIRTKMLIKVSVLGEMAFCQRAGIISLEGGLTDTSDEFDDGGPNLGFLPSYDVKEIQEHMSAKVDIVLFGAMIGAPVAVGLLVFGLLFDWLIAIGLLLPFGIGVFWWIGVVKDIFLLARKLNDAEDAEPLEPDPNFRVLQPVNWWSLLKAGYEPIDCELPLREDRLKLTGKPWRVLQRGSVRIPVFRKLSEDFKIHEQHIIKAAAYGHLIRECQGGESPYGVILIGNECKGIAVPFGDNDENRLEVALKETRRAYAEVDRDPHRMPPVPKFNLVCRNCPFGTPRQYMEGTSETHLDTVQLVPFLTRGADKKTYHSTCGDRFRWVPPHEVAMKNKLC